MYILNQADQYCVINILGFHKVMKLTNWNGGNLLAIGSLEECNNYFDLLVK